MSDEYGGMSISDWNSAKNAVTRHLAVLLQKDSNYRGILDTILVHILVDSFMAQQRPDLMSPEEFFHKYTTLFREGLGISFQSLESGNG